MDCVNYLKNNQEIVYKILKNSLEKNKLFHAYLLSGQTGTPLLEIAKFFAKSMVCENQTPFADETCLTCQRIKNDTFADLIIINGQETTIKKEDILKIESEFSKTSQENNGKKIYIIHLIENMADDCVNALLKFLEEPTEDTYAILTTENEFRILPTILSRTEIIHFNLLDKKTLIESAISLEVSEDDAQLLSNFHNDAEAIKNAVNEEYSEIKNLAISYTEKISNKNETRFFIEDKILPNIKTKEDARFLFDVFIFIFKESYSFKFQKSTIYTSYVKIFEIINSKIKKVDLAIIDLMNARNELNFNLNIDLLILNTLTKIIGD